MAVIKSLGIIRQQDIVVSDGAESGRGRRAIGYACPLFRRTICIGAIGLAWKPSEKDETLDPQIESNIKSVLLKGSKEIRRRLSYEE